MYIDYFWVTFGYHVVPIDGINLTKDVHTDSPDLHDGLITILVLFLHMGLDKCIWDVECCNVLSFLCFTSLLSGQFLLCSWLDSLLHHPQYMCVVCFHLHNVGTILFCPIFSVKNRSDSIPLCLSDLLSKGL